MIRSDAPAVEADALGLKPRALLIGRGGAQPDDAAGSDNAVPGEAIAVEAQKAHHQAMVQWVAGGGCDGGVRRGASARDPADDAQDGCIALLILRVRFADEGALESASVFGSGFHTPQ